jgi:hypothetical protein
VNEEVGVGKDNAPAASGKIQFVKAQTGAFVMIVLL